MTTAGIGILSGGISSSSAGKYVQLFLGPSSGKSGVDDRIFSTHLGGRPGP